MRWGKLALMLVSLQNQTIFTCRMKFPFNRIAPFTPAKDIAAILVCKQPVKGDAPIKRRLPVIGRVYVI